MNVTSLQVEKDGEFYDVEPIAGCFNEYFWVKCQILYISFFFNSF